MHKFFGSGFNIILNQLIPIICIICSLIAALHGVKDWYCFLLIMLGLEFIYLVRSI